MLIELCKRPLAVLHRAGGARRLLSAVCDSIGNPVRTGLSTLGEGSAGQAAICFLGAYACSGKGCEPNGGCWWRLCPGDGLLIEATVRKTDCDVSTQMRMASAGLSDTLAWAAMPHKPTRK